MPVNSTHPDYDANLRAWLRARDVIAGEDAVKAAGESYLPRLDSQNDDEYFGYKSRACFFNASGRTWEGFLGMIFRRDPEVKLPNRHAGVGGAVRAFSTDVDLMGTSLFTYSKGVVGEVLAVGRCGSLVDWAGCVPHGPAGRWQGHGQSGEDRAYVVRYAAEDILNWRTQRINGRNVVTLVVLRENAGLPDGEGDGFEHKPVEQIRVLRLVPVKNQWQYQVEVWRKAPVKAGSRTKANWEQVEIRTPSRRGKTIPLIPFVFHGPRNALPDVDKMPLADIISVNLDHYRLDADYKHGLHFTALPTAWVSGFDKTSELRIGSSTAWVAETPGAVAGFLEFKGHGLSTFENAQNRDERLMAVLGSRMLEDTKRVGETADAIELRQAGENSILMTLALSVSDSISQVLRWVYWWNSTEQYPEDISESLVLLQINTDFTAKGLTSLELTAIVSAWQAGAISQATMFDLFRKGEVLPTGRTDDEEKNLVQAGQTSASRTGKFQNGQEKQTGGLPNAGTTPATTTPPAQPQSTP